MANLTLSVPDDLLDKARRHAVTKGVSLNALIREYLGDLTGREEQLRRSAQKFLELSNAYGGKLEQWEREDLYEL
ncbi:MAG: hypothetical protein Q7J27_00905 [Syntrophales bacterium]|nr:hypothetical protein [Syntrophales bacterium]